MKKDALGTRMKAFYEDRTRHYLPRKQYAIIRVDGKAFHTFTKELKTPFDACLIDAMNFTAQALCKEIQGAKFAYVQSDEISVVLTDFDEIKTDAWFDYNIQKMASVAASIATRAFNVYWTNFYLNSEDYLFIRNLALFDARVFSIGSRNEVVNYFIWRQQDAIRNSIASVAQSLYSHKELHGKNAADQLEMIPERDQAWEDYSDREKRGGLVIKDYFERNGAQRSHWITRGSSNFMDNKEYFFEMLPELK